LGSILSVQSVNLNLVDWTGHITFRKSGLTVR
jgi:hypothetical protein